MILISSYCAPLAQRAWYLALHSSLFGPDGTVNYAYIVTNSINFVNWLQVYSQCYPECITFFGDLPMKYFTKRTCM